MRWDYPLLDINPVFNPWFIEVYIWAGSGIIIIIIIITIITYVYVFSTCTGLAEKQIRFSQGLSLVWYLHLRFFCFCIVEFWVVVNLNYRKKAMQKTYNQDQMQAFQ